MKFFYEGGPLFMGVITICGLLMLFASGYKIFRMFAKKEFDLFQLSYILLFGSLAAVIGFLGQGIGLFYAMEAISIAGDVSPALMAGGFKVSLIAPIYGTILFILSLLLWGILKEINLRRTKG